MFDYPYVRTAFLKLALLTATLLALGAPAYAQSGTLIVTVYDGTRRPLTATTPVLLRVFDGNQKELVSGFYRGSSVSFEGLPVRDNGSDRLRVVAWTKGYDTEGVVGVKIAAGKTVSAAIMLLPRDSQFVFEPWSSLRAHFGWLADLLAHGTADDDEAQTRYDQLIADDPAALAAVLNITTAGNQVEVGGSKFTSYFKELIWQEQRQEWRMHRMVGFNPANDSEHAMRHDRFWAWADRSLVAQVRQGVAEGKFFREVGFQYFHPLATSSFKERALNEGHIHVSFYEKDTRVIDGVECVLLEIHLDLYQDLLAHGLLEVLPNTTTGSVTEPEDAYQLRWIASRQSGRIDFAPPFVITTCAKSGVALRARHRAAISGSQR